MRVGTVFRGEDNNVSTVFRREDNEHYLIVGLTRSH